YEMMLSETQERMLLVVEKGREQEIIDIFTKHDVDSCIVGEVIEEEFFRVIHQGETYADIPADALDENAPVYHLPKREPAYFKEFQEKDVTIPHVENYGETLKALLGRLTIASKEWAYEQFDSNMHGRTVAGPGSGAAVVQIEDRDKAIAITADSNSRYIYLDPKTGGKIAVAEAARNIVCSGAKPLAITDGLNFGNATNEEIFWQMSESIDGLSEACRSLNTPVISGNVSMYNQADGTPIFPTPIVGMVGLVESLDHVTPSAFQQEGDAVYLIGETTEDFGGSELQQLVNKAYEGKAPAIDLSVEAERQNALLKAIKEGVIQSATDLSEGGLAVALSESLFAHSLGAHVNLVHEDITTALFSETQSRFLVSVKEENKKAFEQLMPEANHIGH